MAYSWDNRVKYVVRYMYDIDNNGFLDKNDFECLALRNTLIEGRGEWSADKYAANQKIMSNLWNEIAELADFNKDGEVTVDEFKQAVQKNCNGKPFADFPAAFKTFIANQFKTVDVNGDGLVGVDEYRLDCISRSAFSSVSEIDEAYDKLVTDEDKKAGGISLTRYQELYAQFISNPDEKCNAVYLFGPLKVVPSNDEDAYSWDNRVKYVVRYMYDIDNNGFLDKNDFECLAVRVTLIEGRGEWSADKYAANQKIMSSLWNEIAELADFNKNGEVTVEEFKQAVKKHCVGKSFATFPGAFKTFIGNQFKTVDVNGMFTAAQNNNMNHPLVSEFGLNAIVNTIVSPCCFLTMITFHQTAFTHDGEVSDDEFKQAVKTHCVGKQYQGFPNAFKAFIANQFKTVDVNGDGLVGVDEYRLDCISRSAFSSVTEIDEAYDKLVTADDKKAGGISLTRYQDLYAQFISNPDSTNASYLFGPLKVVA